MDLKREVLRERNLPTLSDAILSAERTDAVDKFAKFGFKGPPVRKDDYFLTCQYYASRHQR